MAKSKYQEWLTEDGLLLLEGWARRGLTEEQISHNMGITAVTLRDWKKKYPSIFIALKKGKEVVDIEVENALFKSAEGFFVEEEVWERQKVDDGQYELVLAKKVKKFVPPSNVAQIFWLKNRRPQDWRDKVESHLNANVSTSTKTIAELINAPVSTRDLTELINEAKEDEGEGSHD